MKSKVYTVAEWKKKRKMDDLAFLPAMQPEYLQQIMQKTIWIIIEDYPQYQVSNRGSIRRLGKDGKPLYIRGSLNENGYVFARLRDKNGKRNKIYTHKLVIEAFLGKRWNKGLEIHRKDTIKTRNRLDNLEYMEKEKHKCLHSRGSY